MKNKLKSIIKKVFLKRELQQLQDHEITLRLLGKSAIKSRALTKALFNSPITVMFVCHEPSLWSMFASLYREMDSDPDFKPIVVALPYKHPSLPKGIFKDSKMFETCKMLNIEAINGYCKATDTWKDPVELLPDYVFFQTPYEIFPVNWSIEQMSVIANVCYIPYATSLFSGVVDDTLHPQQFFKYVHGIFKESNYAKNAIIKKFEAHDWFKPSKVSLSGHPKLDYLNRREISQETVWKRSLEEKLTRILWTPRWNTSEGCCHFFDYKDYFTSFCKEHREIDFTFRPHPLCFQNFIQTGELNKKDLNAIEAQYGASTNQVLDRTAEYQNTFLTCDILVSDVSSMMLEFFAIGKPIIYTHRENVFNELGQKLAEGMYWVRSEQELDQVLKMLIAGEDPLKEKRMKLKKTLVYLPEKGAGGEIKLAIRRDFYSGLEKN